MSAVNVTQCYLSSFKRNGHRRLSFKRQRKVKPDDVPVANTWSPSTCHGSGRLTLQQQRVFLTSGSRSFGKWVGVASLSLSHLLLGIGDGPVLSIQRSEGPPELPNEGWGSCAKNKEQFTFPNSGDTKNLSPTLCQPAHAFESPKEGKCTGRQSHSELGWIV